MVSSVFIGRSGGNSVRRTVQRQPFAQCPGQSRRVGPLGPQPGAGGPGAAAGRRRLDLVRLNSAMLGVRIGESRQRLYVAASYLLPPWVSR
jgi:hypothetical protein